MTGRDKVNTSLVVVNDICLVVMWPETARHETRCPLNCAMLFSCLSLKVPLLVNTVLILTNIGLTKICESKQLSHYFSCNRQRRLFGCVVAKNHEA